MPTTSVRTRPSPALGLALVAMVALLGVIALINPSAAQSEPTATPVTPTTAPPTTEPTDATVPPTTDTPATTTPPTTVPAAPVPATPPPTTDAAPSPRGRPLVVGDSLSYGARNLFPAEWWVRAWPGLALYQAFPLLTDSQPRGARCVVIAFGSNDVSHNRSEVQMGSSINRANRLLAGHPCVLWTTVKVAGVGFYGHGQWVRSAQRWNRLITDHAAGTILDWNAIAATHPRWFIQDGLHMTLAGRQAYAAFLRNGVAANR